MGGRRGHRDTGFPKEQHPGPGNEEELRWLRSVSVKGRPGLSSCCATPKLTPSSLVLNSEQTPILVGGGSIPFLVGLHPSREQ